MSIPEFLKSATTAAYFQGVATLTAVLVAIFVREYLAYRRQPNLHVEFDRSQNGDLAYVPPDRASKLDDQEREEMWIRLRIRNSGSTPARDVQLRCIYTLREGDPERENRPSLGFKVSNLDAFSLTVPQKFTQYFDLAYLRRMTKPPENDISFFLAMVRGDFKSWKQEKPWIEANSDKNQLDIGLFYTLVFAVVSSNADAKYFELKVRAVARKTDDTTPLGELFGVSRLKSRIEITVRRVQAHQVGNPPSDCRITQNPSR